VATGAWTVHPGDYEVLVGRSATNIVRTAPLPITGPPPAPRVVVDRRCLAVDFDDHENATIVDRTRVSGDAVAGPATLLFRDVDLSGAVGVEAEVAGAHAGPRLEFRVDDRRLAEIAVPVTDRYTWTTVTAALPAPLAGVHDLHVTLHVGCRLAAFRFTSDWA
jgi:beta-glucosidase